MINNENIIDYIDKTQNLLQNYIDFNKKFNESALDLQLKGKELLDLLKNTIKETAIKTKTPTQSTVQVIQENVHTQVEKEATDIAMTSHENTSMSDYESIDGQDGFLTAINIDQTTTATTSERVIEAVESYVNNCDKLINNIGSVNDFEATNGIANNEHEQGDDLTEEEAKRRLFEMMNQTEGIEINVNENNLTSPPIMSNSAITVVRTSPITNNDKSKIENDNQNETNQVDYVIKDCHVVLTRIDPNKIKLTLEQYKRQKALLKSNESDDDDDEASVDYLCNINNIINSSKKIDKNAISKDMSRQEKKKKKNEEEKDQDNSSSLLSTSSDDDADSEVCDLFGINNETEITLNDMLNGHVDNDTNGDSLLNDNKINDNIDDSNASENDDFEAIVNSNKNNNNNIKEKNDKKMNQNQIENNLPSLRLLPSPKESEDENEDKKNNDNESNSDIMSLNEENDKDDDYISKNIKKKCQKAFLISDEDSKQSLLDAESLIKNENDSNEKNKRNTRSSKVVKNESSKKKDENSSSGDDDSVEGDFKEFIKKTNSRKRKVKNRRSLNSDDEDDDLNNKKLKKTKKNVSEEEEETDGKDDDDEEESDDDDDINLDDTMTNGIKRKKIRKIMDDSKLKTETQNALAAENERLKRIEKQLASKNEIIPIAVESDDSEPEELNLTLTDNNASISAKASTSINSKPLVYLDIDEKTQKPLLQIDKSIANNLKDHQINGIKFMWVSCFESVEAIKQNNPGGGCVLAHCMGLGKTLQVIALVHTLLVNSDLTKVKRVIVLTPINALPNWVQEFDNWLRKCKKRISVTEITADSQSVKDRLNSILKWYKNGGVLIIGYSLFVNLADGKTLKAKQKADILECLINPGCDLIVCDEGHMLKNEKTKTSLQINRVQTKRRIVLTGSPLQNNLKEYHCMVSFVKPNLLGTIKEFSNRFINPINNGQHADSTDADVINMKKRAHVLHQTLVGCVQRKDYNVIKPLIPPKKEFVLLIRLSDVQRSLYKTYMEREGIDKIEKLTKAKIKGARLFADFQNLLRIWSHPWIVRVHSLDQQEQLERKSLSDFITSDEDSSFCEEIDANTDDCVDDEDDGAVKASKRREFNSKTTTTSEDNHNENGFNGLGEGVDEIEYKPQIPELLNENDNPISTRITRSRKQQQQKNLDDENASTSNGATTTTSINDTINAAHAYNAWWNEIIKEDCEYSIEVSGKMVVFAEILKKCEEIGDKLLVFSGSKFVLDLIERFLKHWSLTNTTKNGTKWLPLIDYYRIDGDTATSNRKKYINDFNDEDNNRMRLFLISSKAGGIGINLVAANRVIIFDVSWNPVHDLQSMFRVYRFGQKKPVYIYRFLAQGTMEEKIYQRQVAKQSLASRVIDEHQLVRHFTSTELQELYAFDPDIYDDKASRPTPMLPSDSLLADLIISHDRWIVKYHEHDSLLENKIDESLTEEERKAAWEEYEREKQGRNNSLLREQLFNDLLIQQQQQITNDNNNDLMNHYIAQLQQQQQQNNNNNTGRNLNSINNFYHAFSTGSINPQQYQNFLMQSNNLHRTLGNNLHHSNTATIIQQQQQQQSQERRNINARNNINNNQQNPNNIYNHQLYQQQQQQLKPAHLTPTLQNLLNNNIQFNNTNRNTDINSDNNNINSINRNTISLISNLLNKKQQQQQ